METWLLQLKIVIKNIFNYFNEYPISFVFLILIICIFLLNITRRIFIWQEKKSKSQYQRCKYLVNLGDKQDCDILSQRKQFIEKGNSCVGCRGKSFGITDIEAENRIAIACMWKYVIILLANYSRNTLPYISFFYTLAVTIFQKNN